ncbi:MAG TPA: CrcB family protein [Solirubrobacteraceae bacterium]|nr:CrcB family protein [Solirubrobacteraceae bacterium]
MTLALVALAGAAGVTARYALGLLSASVWTTLAINVAGSLAPGVLVGAGRGLAPEVRDAVAIGLLGGFTTFSTFSLQAVTEVEAGRVAAALLYVAASVLLGVGSAAAGYATARALAG